MPLVLDFCPTKVAEGGDGFTNLVNPLVWPEPSRRSGQQQPTTFIVLVSTELRQVAVEDREVDTLLDARSPTVLSRLAVEEVGAALYLEGVAQAEQGNLAEAVHALRQCVQAEPEHRTS